ncbi:hypothetical protein [Myroides indicus]|uniref:Putative GTP pyrophosphokinase n=1 Tax=Myroides indicus TaxID=1323422 RepID=A0A4V3E9D0_9FLAO|nr:hypothetical protein [Myroides indicus]TDS65291.1 putative GTP pyrophosphokinase [Myroides indicus]
MQRKNYIARVLLLVAFMFTIVFQFTHSYSHILSSVLYENEHSTHAHFNEKREDTGKTLEWKEKHSPIEKCFACNFILNPCLSVDIEQIVFYNYETIRKVQDAISERFIPLSHIYYSLRAPPFTV